MSSEENKEIALSLLEALNTRDLSLWSQHLAEDYIAEHPGVSVPDAYPPASQEERNLPE
jgi:ketosteroid isomerase-like protein